MRQARAAAQQAGASGRQVGSLGAIWSHPRWRRNLLVGVGLGLSGMAGLWGIGFFSPELISTALRGEPQHVIDVVRVLHCARDVDTVFGDPNR